MYLPFLQVVWVTWDDACFSSFRMGVSGCFHDNTKMDGIPLTPGPSSPLPETTNTVNTS